MKIIDDAVEIPFFIPPTNDVDSHHVISRGQKPKFHRAQDLLDKGQGKTLWVDQFEKILVGLYLALDAPVPYCFFTPDGQIRSLDAGCLKWMLNRNPPDILLNIGAEGYISTVRPSEQLMNRYAPIHERLRNKILSAKAL